MRCRRLTPGSSRPVALSTHDWGLLGASERRTGLTGVVDSGVDATAGLGCVFPIEESSLDRPPKLAEEAWRLLDSSPARPPRRQLSVAENRELLRRRIPDFGAPAPVASVQDQIVSGRVDVAVRVYRPTPDRQLPVVVYAHGGGWALGDLDTHDGICRSIAARVGCAVISVDYRRPPEARFPAAWQDVQDVVRAVWDDPETYGVDSSRLALAGDSAGGQLAAATALWARSESIALRHLLLFMPDVDNHPEQWPSVDEFAEGYAMHPDDQIWYYEQYFGPDWRSASGIGVSPVRAELHGMPPTTVITAECDPVRDEGEEFSRRLVGAGVPTELRRFDGMFHPFVLFRDLRATREAEAYVAGRLLDAFQ